MWCAAGPPCRAARPPHESGRSCLLSPKLPLLPPQILAQLIEPHKSENPWCVISSHSAATTDRADG